MAIYGKHLTRHKMVYERHKAGETYVSIGAELGISAPRVRSLALRWERELARKSETMMTPDEFTTEMLKIIGQPPDFQLPENGNRRELNASLGDNYSPDTAHSEADELIISLLESLGYSTGARIFQAMTKWYS